MSDATLGFATARAVSDRRPAIEAARVVAVLGVVWFHMQAPGWRVAYATLGFFVMLAVALAARSVARRGRTGYLRVRLPRLAWPWLAWSAAYLALTAVRLGDPVAALTPETARAFLIGPILPLWILPFLLIVSALVALVEPWTRRPRGIVVFALVAAPVSIACFWAQTFAHPPAPFAQWAYGIPAALYALLSAQVERADGWRSADLARSGFLAAVVAGSLMLGATEDIGQFALAALVFELVWRWEMPHADWIVAAGDCVLATYLVHPFVMLVYHKAFADGGHSARAALLVFAVSFAAAAALRCAPMLRRVT